MFASNPSVSEPVAEQMADADITRAVEFFFLTKKGIHSHLIDVLTREGIVELTGSTDSLLSRQRAEDVALAVRGVRGVINELLVHAPEVPDQQLQRDIFQALDHNPATTDLNVRFTVADGVVTLTGSMQSWAEKQLVLRVVQGTRGVRRIEADYLQVSSGENVNSDEEMTTEIQELLDWDIRLNSRLVQVRTTDQVVHLAGTVGTAAEKDHVVALAYQVGAAHVDARDLFVAPWALNRELRRDKFAPRTDAEVTKAVRDTLRLDPRVRATDVLVRVHDGTVTLTGAVSNLRARRAAEQDARHVVGVWDVYNLLKVRTERISPDADIQATIVEALARSPYLSHFTFVVNVRNGKATLYGRVDNHFEQEQAEEVAAGVNEVVDVENRVEVGGSPSLFGFVAWGSTPAAAQLANSPNPDHALAERIRQRLYWSAALHDQEVEVQVDNGRATLTGTVDTWLDRKQAALDAYEAGARDVNNHLRVATAAA